MDIKKRTKSVKEKLKQLGYDVKHTHCREVLAVAHGLRNSHVLKTNQESNDSEDNYEELFLAMGVDPHSENEFYSDILRGVKLRLSSEENSRIMKARNFARENSCAVNFSFGEIIYFESLDGDGFLEYEDAEEMQDILDSNIILNDKEFFEKDNVNRSQYEFSHEIIIDKGYLSLRVFHSSDKEECLYSSSLLNLDQLNKEF